MISCVLLLHYYGFQLYLFLVSSVALLCSVPLVVAVGMAARLLYHRRGRCSPYPGRLPHSSYSLGSVLRARRCCDAVAIVTYDLEIRELKGHCFTHIHVSSSPSFLPSRGSQAFSFVISSVFRTPLRMGLLATNSLCFLF